MKEIPPGALISIEYHFHALIRQRVRALVERPPSLQLPKIDDTTPSSDGKKAWFPVPGMYGGFAYWLNLADDLPKLICSSWSRIIPGSGETHEIHAEGSELMEKEYLVQSIVFES